jgi:hypothetical protein
VPLWCSVNGEDTLCSKGRDGRPLDPREESQQEYNFESSYVSLSLLCYLIVIHDVVLSMVNKGGKMQKRRQSNLIL